MKINRKIARPLGLIGIFSLLLTIIGIGFFISPWANKASATSLLIGHNPDTSRKISASVDVVTDWPQVQRDPQRTGYSPEVLGSNIQITWVHDFTPEKIFPQVQAIVYNGNVYVGTEMGKMYALDARTGNLSWVYDVGAPVLNSVAAGDGKIFFGAMDGAVYGLDASSGSRIWKASLLWRHGFSTAPVLAESKVMLGGRNGVFFALDSATGNVLWQYDVGAPILQTAAWDNGRVFFGAMDMHVYALNTSNGSLAWQSQSVTGMAFKDYWPVIHQGKVIIRPMGIGSVTDITYCDANPGNCKKTMVIFDEASGAEAPTVMQYDSPTHSGTVASPCVDRDGYLVVPNGTGWGRLNLNTRLIFDTLISAGNSDETENVSCANNLIFIFHIGDGGGAGISGFVNLDNRNWTSNQTIDFQPSYNTQGGGGNPPSIANGMIYHITLHHLIARTANP